MPRMAGLLAGLILAVHLGAPLDGCGMQRCLVPIGPGCAEPIDSDGDEAATFGVDPLLCARGRAQRLSAPRHDHWPECPPTRSVPAPCPSPGAGEREEAGHFLAEGRPFRHWIQSLTC